MSGFTLGVDWLGAQLLGVPVGMWLVGLAVGAAHLADRRWPAWGVAIASEDGAERVRHAPERPREGRRPGGAEKAGVFDLSGRAVLNGALELAGVPASSMAGIRERVSTLAQAVSAGSRTLRMGVDLRDADAKQLTDAGAAFVIDGIEIEWARAEAGLVTDGARDARAFDALLRRERGGDLVLFVPEHPKRPAAWPDWSESRLLGYASVFPPRLDTARCRLAGCDLSDGSHAALAVRAVVLAAILGRCEARVEPASRWFGRSPLPDLEVSGGTLDRAFEGLKVALGRFRGDHAGSVPGMVRTMAGLLGARCAASEGGIAGDRSAQAALAAELLDGSPEALLRLGACQVACGETAEAKRTFARATRELQEQRASCAADPLAFVMSEAELGTGSRLTLGRVAAGVVLLWATTPPGSLDYLRDDLLDDLRHAGWLKDREADLRLLQEIMEQVGGQSPVRRRSGAAA